MNFVQSIAEFAQTYSAWAGPIAFAIALAYIVYYLPGLQSRNSSILLLASATTYFVADTGLIATVIGLENRKSLKPLWIECYSWAFPYYLVGAVVAGVISWLNRSFPWETSLLVVPASLIANLKRLRAIPPDYPPAAMAQRIAGSVTLEYSVDTHGEPRDIHVVEATPPGMFDQAAINAVKRWRYAPMVVDGKAVERGAPPVRQREREGPRRHASIGATEAVVLGGLRIESGQHAAYIHLRRVHLGDLEAELFGGSEPEDSRKLNVALIDRHAGNAVIAQAAQRDTGIGDRHRAGKLRTISDHGGLH